MNGLTLLVAMTLSGSAGTASRLAVVVGNNDGGSGKGELRYAEADARRVAELFGTLGHVGELELLLGEDAGALEAALDRVTAQARRASEPPVVLFFYSGHADDQALLMGESRFAFATLRQRLQALPARVTIAFVDACQSGRLTRTKGGKVVPVVDVRFEDNRSYSGHVFVTSSAVGEVSQEADEIEASFFTHYLLSGLRGAADLSGDGQVSLDEAYQYVYRHTLLRTSGTFTGPQHPTYDVDVTGRGELILTRLEAADGALLWPAELAGTYLVRARRGGALFAEVVKERGAPLRLALPAGQYEVARLESDAQRVKAVALAATGEVIVDERGMERRPLSRGQAKGATTHLLVAGYRLRSPAFAEATPSHAGRLAYLADLGLLHLGAAIDYGGARYQRRDGLAVELGELDVALLGERRVGLLRPWQLWLGGATGVGWTTQRGRNDDGAEQRLASAVFFYEARLGIGVSVEPLLVGLWGAVGQRFFRDGDGLRGPWVGSLQLGLGSSF